MWLNSALVIQQPVSFSSYLGTLFFTRMLLNCKIVNRAHNENAFRIAGGCGRATSSEAARRTRPRLSWTSISGIRRWVRQGRSRWWAVSKIYPKHAHISPSLTARSGTWSGRRKATAPSRPSCPTPVSPGSASEMLLFHWRSSNAAEFTIVCWLDWILLDNLLKKKRLLGLEYCTSTYDVTESRFFFFLPWAKPKLSERQAQVYHCKG